MDSIINTLNFIRSLSVIPCHIKKIEFVEENGGNKITKVCIYLQGHLKEAKKAINCYEYSPYCIVLYKEQYDILLDSLFKEIKRLNQDIFTLQQKI